MINRLIIFIIFIFQIPIITTVNYVDKEAMFSDYTLTELSIFAVGNALNRASTVVGKHYFQKMFHQSASDHNHAIRCQKIVLIYLTTKRRI